MLARFAALPAGLRRLAPLWRLSPVLLLLFLWTWTESAAVTLHVADDHCTAVLYGRSSAIDCPDLPGGSLITTLVAGGAEATGDPPARLMPPPRWAGLALTAAGQAVAADPLPVAFDVAATLRRPRQPAGLILLRSDGRTGYAFILDAANRRGAWWLWDEGPAMPLRGIPLDRPFIEQAKPFLRQLLAGWPAAAALALLAALCRRRYQRPPTNDHPVLTPATHHPPLAARLPSASEDADSALAAPATRYPPPATRLPSASEDADSALAAPPTRYPPPATRRPNPWPLVPLLLLSFALPLHVAVDVLEGIPHVQDSVTYLFQAQTLAGGALTAPAPPLAAADGTAHFEQEFLLVRDGRWFGKYPPGWPALLALGVLAGAPWLVNPLLAVVTVALVYHLAKLSRRAEAHGSRGAGEQGRRTPATHHAPPATRPTDPLTTDPLNTDLLNTVHCLLPTLFLATSPFFLITSGSLMAHPAELMWAVIFMVGWGRAVGGRRGGLPTRPTRWAVVAGLALGALFLTRQFTALTIGLAFGGGLLMMTWRRPAKRVTSDERRVTSVERRVTSEDTPDSSPATRVPSASEDAYSALAAPATHPTDPLNTDPLNTDLLNTVLLNTGLLKTALLAALPFLLALPLYQLAVTGDARTDPRLLYWPYDRVGFGPGIGESQNAFTMTMPARPANAGPAITWYTDADQPPRGHSPARGLYNLGRNLDALQGDLFGWPPSFTLAFVWLAFLLRRPAAGDWLLLLVVLAVAGGYVAYWSAGIAYGPRYFYAALPALVILSARGVIALAARGGWRVAGGVLLLLVGYNLVTLPGRLDDYRGYNYVSSAGQRAVAAAVETPALVFLAAGAADWWEYGAYFSGNTPWLDGPIVYARDLGEDENARLRAAFPDRRAYYWTGEE